MSTDRYVVDKLKHGSLHIDRYNKKGRNVGRYTLQGTPLKQKDDISPPIPRSDQRKFR